MSDIQTFVSWFLNQLPLFLMSEPICYLFGFCLLGLTIKMVWSIIHIHY